jgi:hypothetical protein
VLRAWEFESPPGQISLAKGFPAICAFVNDHNDSELVKSHSSNLDKLPQLPARLLLNIYNALGLLQNLRPSKLNQL